MAEPKTLTLKKLRELAKKHLGDGQSKLKTKADLLQALKKVVPALFKDEPGQTAQTSPQASSKVSSPAKIIKFKTTGGKKVASTLGKFHKGMAVFTIAKGGLMGQATVGGQKFTYKPL